MPRHPQHIAELLMRAENRVKHHSQPYMLPMHGGSFHLQGYSNPYDSPATLGAGSRSGGSRSGGAIISRTPSLVAPRRRGRPRKIAGAGMPHEKMNYAAVMPPDYASLPEFQEALIRIPRAPRVPRAPRMVGGKKKVNLWNVFKKSAKKVGNAAVELAQDPAIQAAAIKGATELMAAGRPHGRPRGRPRKAATGGKVPAWLKKTTNTIKHYGDKAVHGVVTGVEKVINDPTVQQFANEAFDKGVELGKQAAVQAANKYVAGARPRGRPRKPRAPKMIGCGGAALPASGRARNTARGDIVRAIMVQRGVSLPMASKIVKEEGLY